MANGHGGYRRPTNPAPVSGPGAHSRRTDGKQPIMSMPDAAYGEDKTFRELQQGAALPQATLRGTTGAVQPSGPTIVGLGEPTQQPDVPVTDGAAYGPGAGPSALGMQDPNAADAAYYAKYLPVLMKQADDPNTPPGYKQMVRTLLANLPR